MTFIDNNETAQSKWPSASGYFDYWPKHFEDKWASAPGTHHLGGCNLAFADGHVDPWRWKSPTSKGAWCIPVENDRDLQDLRRLQGTIPLLPLNPENRPMHDY